jgi:triosephosphate isomerase
MNASESGPFTGEISAGMLHSIGINKVILGHSERRAYYNETDAGLKQKVETALTHDMEVIFCFGEELDERKAGSHFDVVQSQLETALFDINPTQWSKIILAYEPVWAIGTGETASPEQAQEMHAFIRGLIASKYDQELADHVSILYGGSVKPANALAIFSQPDVDGGLIGGAALNADDFTAIIQSV